MYYIDPSKKDDLSVALRGLDQNTMNFSMRMIKDHNVRMNYMKHSRETCHEIQKAVKEHRITAEKGAKIANEIRNDILSMMRNKSSEVGRALAESKKPVLYSLDYLEKKYAQQLFKQEFSSLNDFQKNEVWKLLIERSGVPNAGINRVAQYGGYLGKGLVVVTAAIVVHNIYASEDKKEAVKDEVVNLTGGALGASLGGGLAGLACGPGAPACVALGVFIGGALTSYGIYHVKGMYYR